MKFRNDSTMTWSSSDSDGGMVVTSDHHPPDELCLHFDDVSLIELGRDSNATRGGGEKRRSIEGAELAISRTLSATPNGHDGSGVNGDQARTPAVNGRTVSANGNVARFMSDEPNGNHQDSAEPGDGSAPVENNEDALAQSILDEEKAQSESEQVTDKQIDKEEIENASVVQDDKIDKPADEDEESADPPTEKPTKSVRFFAEDESPIRDKPDGAASDDSPEGDGETPLDESPGDPPSPAPESKIIFKPKGILKRPGKEKHKNRVTFNELMTVFADGYPEVQVPAFRPWDLADILCFAYEPPPGYRDWDSFDPPAEYMDLVEASMGVTNFHGDEEDSNGGEMIEIYRTEFEYSADAVEEMMYDGSGPEAGLEVAGSQVTSFRSEEEEREEVKPTEDESNNEAEERYHEDTPEEGEAEEARTNEVVEFEEDVKVLDTVEEESPVQEEDESVPEETVDGSAEAVESEEEMSADSSQNDNHHAHGAVTDNEDSGPETADEPSSPESTIERPVVQEKTIMEEEEEEDDKTDKDLDSADELGDSSSASSAWSTTSQIRKSIEMNALRRSLLRGSDVCRRRNPNQRPKSPTTSSIEEKLRWLTSTEDLSIPLVPVESKSMPIEQPRVPREVTPEKKVPPVAPIRTTVPPQDAHHYVLQPRPTRWASEVLYSSSSASSTSSASLSSSPNSLYDSRPQLPSFRPPPSRPASFDPTLGTLAWEGYLQRDRYGCGGSSLSLMRAPYVYTVERHPNAATGPGGQPRCKDPTNPTSDELEWFVQRDQERIERIKKRYSLTEEDDPTFGFGRRPSVRGIRPRFGSTNEILQQLQSQMRPPRPVPLGHQKTPSVPAQGPPRPQYRPNMVLTCGPGGDKTGYVMGPQHRVQHVVVPSGSLPPGAHPRTVVVLPRVNEEGGPLPAIVRVRTKDDHIPNGGIYSKLAGPGKDERGAPEGASSSPKVSSDPLYPVHAMGTNHPNMMPPVSAPGGQAPKEGIIYYSLRV